ncbi:helix-turn-helix domain-containing protein [Actinokineospora guangxiensis]|uniref:Helix-turn-helix domain-containing protein n=1 Tax=Actinokineospora guangxiensis TaxID=1490288 RepID=A0ABW0EXN1_9PSEU
MTDQQQEAYVEFNLPDEAAPYLEESLANPQFKAAYDDEGIRHKIIDSLIRLRRALRLTQSEVARRMGVRQPTVSNFETEASDPKLSTLQRYARAVEAQVHVVIVMPPHCDWVSSATLAYRPNLRQVRSTEPAVRHRAADSWRSFGGSTYVRRTGDLVYSA